MSNKPEKFELLRSYIEEAVKSGRFADEETAIARILELLHQNETVPPTATRKRLGGQWKGQVTISPDFDDLPDDIAESFGIQ